MSTGKTILVNLSRMGNMQQVEVSPSITVKELLEIAEQKFGLAGSGKKVTLIFDGKKITEDPTKTLMECHIYHGSEITLSIPLR